MQRGALMFRRFKNLFVFALVAAIGTAGLSGCGGNSETVSDIDLTKIQRLSYDATNEHEIALEKFNKGCEPAKIIRDDKSQTNKNFCLIFQGAKDSVTVEKILQILDEKNIKATFAITAATAAEDDALIDLIIQKGHDIIDNGLNGDSSIDVLSDEDMVSNFSDSRKVFSTLMDVPPDKMMLNTTYYNDTICMAASASGYSKLVSPSSGSYLNEKSFRDDQNTFEYVSRQGNGRILVIKLDEYVESLEVDPKVEYKDPAIDVQPTIVSASEEDEDKRDVVTMVGWLLDAMQTQGIDNVKLDKLKALNDEEYVRQLYEETGGYSAEVYEEVATMQDVTGLCFYGIPENVESVDAITKALIKAGAKATFFLSSEDIEKNPKAVEKIVNSGFSIATRGTTGGNISNKEFYDIYVDLKTSVRSIQKNYGLKAKYYMPEDESEITENLRIAAKVAGLDIVSPKNDAIPEKGNISCFDLTRELEMEKLNAYISSTAGKNQQIVDITELVRSSTCAPVTDKETLESLRMENHARLAQERKNIYTSERAVTMTFYGISNKAVLNDVLSILKLNGYKATFFVTPDELSRCGESITKILNGGNEIGIAYVSNSQVDQSYDEVAGYILGAQQYAQWKYDVRVSVVMQPYGIPTKDTKEAVASCGCSLAGYEYSMVQSKDRSAVDLSFYTTLAKKVEAHRGSVIYFNMNYYTADQDAAGGDGTTLLAELLNKFIETKIYALTYKDVYGKQQASTAYTVKTFSELASSQYVYSPIKNSQKIVSNNNNIVGALPDNATKNAYMAGHYIGNPDVTYIPGFTDDEMKAYDKTGKISKNKVIFLTFDDWGYEQDINELLYVLDKYKVKGNFFVRTNNVADNPNLLRAIAVDGHMIGSHSNSHMVAWNSTQNPDGTYTYESISEEAGKRLRADVVNSYSTLNKYCGDVVVDGRRALSTIYRPPTLAMSRIAMENIFDVGFTYIVSGDFSSGDYNCSSVDEVVNILRNGKSAWYGTETIGNGSCIVLHMSPNAQFTAEALDIMIPEWRAQGYRFARLDDYLK